MVSASPVLRSYLLLYAEVSGRKKEIRAIRCISSKMAATAFEMDGSVMEGVSNVHSAAFNFIVLLIHIPTSPSVIN